MHTHAGSTVAAIEPLGPAVAAIRVKAMGIEGVAVRRAVIAVYNQRCSLLPIRKVHS
jgi:hypothetical protein